MDGYFWVDTEGERLASRAGAWNFGAGAGVFACIGLYSRSNVGTYIGFRSAYIRPSEICDPENLNKQEGDNA